MISLRVEIGIGPISDALEECYQLGLKLQIPISFAARDSEWKVFPAWASADEINATGVRFVWQRDGSRIWSRQTRSAST